MCHSECIDGRRYLYLQNVYEAERGIANHLLRLTPGDAYWPPSSIDRIIRMVTKTLSIELSASQINGLHTILTHKVSFVTGGPGVGKTTLMNAVMASTHHANQTLQISLAAPTGRAAKRMSENCLGLGAKTIHRLLEFDAETYAFKRNEYNPLPVDLLIIDEASMIDVILMHQLLSAIPDHAQLIIVGDADQLPAIGPGMVLKDCLSARL